MYCTPTWLVLEPWGTYDSLAPCRSGDYEPSGLRMEPNGRAGLRQLLGVAIESRAIELGKR